MPRAALLTAILMAGSVDSAEPPNVILVITDDQGYGDVSAHGNEMLKTPHLDRLHGQSVRLTDFHVDPTCSPTRSALMTGRYSTRTGVWHTIMGRSLMSTAEQTLAEVFAANGYATGMFGKWHLGDNHPLRPQDQGFSKCLYHGGGGVTQTPDWWGNDYFDDTYFDESGTPHAQSGYCTDVWFDAAMEFMAPPRKDPFFCYLATNAPHGPFLVSEEDKQPYLDAGVAEPMASFYGMIANIDDNMGRLSEFLDRNSLTENTILIFMTDNGTAAGVARNRGDTNASAWRGFNAGMRGQKGSEYDGGHRVPFFIRWPAGQVGGGRDVDILSAHIDVLPTLVELCGIEKPDGPPVDGMSLSSLLRGGSDVEAPQRTLFVHSQRLESPEKWRKSSVMTDRWRLVNGRELFDMRTDPGQRHDIAAEQPEEVERLRGEYDAWWDSLTEVFDDYVRIVLGAAGESPAQLTCHDWHSENVPWNQGAVSRDPEANGVWAVEVAEAGRYAFTLRMRPAPLKYEIPRGTARIRLGEVESEVAIADEMTAVRIEADVPAGPAMLQTWLESAEGASRGAYFVEVERVR